MLANIALTDKFLVIPVAFKISGENTVKKLKILLELHEHKILKAFFEN